MESGSFLISLLAVIIATASTIINYLLFRNSHDPCVEVYAVPDDKRPSFVNLIIENTGNSSAWNVSFFPSKPVPDKAFGLVNPPAPKDMTSGPLVNGIPCLGPKSKRILTWGQYAGLLKGVGEEYIDIEAVYHSVPSLSLWKRKHKSISRIDIKSFEGTDASDNNWDKKIANHLESLSKSLSKVVSSPENAVRVINTKKYDPEVDDF